MAIRTPLHRYCPVCGQRDVWEDAQGAHVGHRCRGPIPLWPPSPPRLLSPGTYYFPHERVADGVSPEGEVPAGAPPWFRAVYFGQRSPTEHWARWTTEDGIYFWLHVTRNVWIGEPEELTMPTVVTREAMVAAVLAAPEPPRLGLLSKP